MADWETENKMRGMIEDLQKAQAAIAEAILLHERGSPLYPDLYDEIEKIAGVKKGFFGVDLGPPDSTDGDMTQDTARKG